MGAARAISLSLALLAGAGACSGGTVDTTKDYYEDSEAPPFQEQISNGETKLVPWKDVPEPSRFIVEWDDPPRDRPKVRVPIVKVVTTSLDEKNRPVPIEKAHWYQVKEYGLNPKYERRGMGGSKH